MDIIINLFAKRIEKLYGNLVKVEFVDIFTEKAQAKFPEIWEQIKSGIISVPVVTVNLEMAVQGNIAISPVIEKLSKVLK